MKKEKQFIALDFFKTINSNLIFINPDNISNI